MTKYSAQATAEEQRFIPAVLDTFGKYGQGLGKLVGLLKDVCGESNTVPDLCLQLQQRVAVALHTGNSIAIAKGLSHAQWTRPLADLANAKSRALPRIQRAVAPPASPPRSLPPLPPSPAPSPAPQHSSQQPPSLQHTFQSALATDSLSGDTVSTRFFATTSPSGKPAGQ